MPTRSVTTVISYLFSPAVLFAVILAGGITGSVEAQIMRSPGKARPQPAKAPRWPKPTQLQKELEVFEDHETTQAWAARTGEIVDYFCSETEVTSKKAVETLLLLQQQSQAVTTLIGRVVQNGSSAVLSDETNSLVSDLQRFQYRLNRRIEVWAAVIDHTNAISARKTTPTKTVSLSSLPPNLDELLQQQVPGNTGWQEYLAWDALVRAARVSNRDKAAQTALRKAAQKFLARYHSPSLTPVQRDLFQPYFSPDILSSIRDAAAGEVDHSLIMILIEGLEQKNSGRFASHLNNQYQNLLWSNDPVAQKLAGTLDSHWRNANFRVAIHQRLLNQLLPQVPSTTEPVSERLQGAKISGQSLIQTDDLRIAFIPNPNEISLAVETIGKVTSDTVARRSGFTFQSHGLADFQVFQKLAFSRTGVTSEEALATSTARQRLIGLRGNYDRVPLIGWLTRKIARQKADEQTPEALQLTKDRVETGAKERVEKEVNQTVNMLRRGLHTHVLSRLISMDLEPETVQLSTSHHRIVGRYRVAGRDQMAAWQPRPTDFESDLLTVQFHQSAVNNLVQRFGLNGQEFDVITLGKHIEKITGIPFESNNAEAEATFEFDKHDAVRVDFEDGIASIKFCFKKFQIGKGRTWKNVDIKANFKPRYIGTQIVLERDNLFEVESKSDLRLADQIAIRGAFKVILEPQYSLDLLPAVVREKIPGLSLGIDRLSLAEGWCAVAFDNAANLNQGVPIVTPDEVNPGSWPNQLGAVESSESRTLFK